MLHSKKDCQSSNCHIITVPRSDRYAGGCYNSGGEKGGDMNKWIYQVDAFSSRPFRGNPAGVMVLDEMPEDARMQAIAAEMNLSETAFLTPRGEEFTLRWFTPATEVELCGHATLASAHILWEQGYLPPEQTAVFHTASGVLKARKAEDWIDMDFPAYEISPAESLRETEAALGVSISALVETGGNLLAELAVEDEVRGLAPDFSAVGNLPYQGVIATSRSDDPDVDFVSRYFAPRVGINEDPVTGSAHSSLGPYWAEKLGKNELRARQISARDGELKVRVTPPRVFISGQAVTIFKAELLV
jgi:PhzF family phenazine biosynthesis protein